MPDGAPVVPNTKRRPVELMAEFGPWDSDVRISFNRNTTRNRPTSRPLQKQYLFSTVSVMPGKYWESIMDVAVDNGGYVTPALLSPFGVPAIELRKMVARNVLTAAAHGVYRVPSLPIENYDEFILARLWAKGRGVVSHDSALLVHELCDINPTKVHITIPHDYRIGKAGAERYAIHRTNLEPSETTRLGAVTVTTIMRTLTDSLTSVPGCLVRQAIETARSQGSIRRSDHERLLHDLESPVSA
jgi:predicted transcriptional regulator of viral defense system